MFGFLGGIFGGSKKEQNPGLKFCFRNIDACKRWSPKVAPQHLFVESGNTRFGVTGQGVSAIGKMMELGPEKTIPIGQKAGINKVVDLSELPASTQRNIETAYNDYVAGHRYTFFGQNCFSPAMAGVSQELLRAKDPKDVAILQDAANSLFGENFTIGTRQFVGLSISGLPTWKTTAILGPAKSEEIVKEWHYDQGNLFL